MNERDPAAELRELAAGLRARLEWADESELHPSPGEPVRRESASSAGSGGAGGEGGAIASGRDAALASMREAVLGCRKCHLGSYRLNPAFGVGSAEAAVLFVGEGPGFSEDHQGEPFVGRAGQLLDKILASIGLSRRTVYIANVVKCHPMIDPSDPEARRNDRPPTQAEIAACRPYLEEQIRLIGPRFIVTLGGVATKAMLGEDVRITKARGQWREYRLPGAERPIRLLPTFHPAALLRDPSLKQDVWTDMKNLKRELEG